VAPPNALNFDPIEEARRHWIEHGWSEAADGMAFIASVMRLQRIFSARVDLVLRRFDLTSARFELLMLLSFTHTGALPMNKASTRLQVHATSVTGTVDRLETQGYVRRLPHGTDRRTILIEILPAGRRVLAKAALALNKEVFEHPPISTDDAAKLFDYLGTRREVATKMSAGAS